MTPQNKQTVKANNAVAASAIKNFVTDILMTPVIRNICVLNPKNVFSRKNSHSSFLPKLLLGSQRCFKISCTEDLAPSLIWLIPHLC
jgi:hypothetical protein